MIKLCGCTVARDCHFFCVQEVAGLEEDDTATTAAAAESLSRASTHAPSATAVSSVSQQYQEEERSSKKSVQDHKELKKSGDSTAADAASMCASAVIAMLFVSCSLKLTLFMFSSAPQCPTVHQLLKEVSAVDWDRLGCHLGIDPQKLKELHQTHREPDSIRLYMFQLWLRREPNASWEDIVTALEDMGENVVAGTVAQNHCVRRYTPGEGANFYMYAYVYMLCTNIYLSDTGRTTDRPSGGVQFEETVTRDEVHPGMIPSLL